MNQRKAKAIRRLARNRTVGLPEREYDDYSPPRYFNRNIGTPAPAQWMKVAKGVPRRLTKCTRLFTKALKRMAQ